MGYSPIFENAVGQRKDTAEWAVILEFTPVSVERPFPFALIKALVDELRPLLPLALWSPDRYTVQMYVPTRDPHDALVLASRHHGEAARAVGLPAATCARVEIVGAEEHRDTFEWSQTSLLDAATPATAGRGLLCDELDDARRRINEATTPAEVTDTVVDFVTAVGGWVQPGTRQDRPDVVDVDVTVETGQPLHATAAAMSVAGLMMEQALPTVLAECRAALDRIHSTPR